MTCVILQPSYIPWRGYFHQIQKADVFVFYDDVQYDRDGWRNRNRIKTPSGSKWLTIPLQARGEDWKGLTIRDMRTAEGEDWRRKHWESIRHSYARAPYFPQYRSMIEAWFEAEASNLADFTIKTTVALADALGIRKTEFIRSSSLSAHGSKTERVLSILGQVKANHYVSGPAAQSYLDVQALSAAGITVEWMAYNYPEYRQLFPPFDPAVSALDLLLNTGPQSGRFVWAE